MHTLCQSSDRIWYSFNWRCKLSDSHQTVSGTASTGAAHSLSVIRPYLVQVQLEIYTLCQSSDRIWYSFNWRCKLSVSHHTVSGTASTGDLHSLSVIRPYLVQLQLELHTLCQSSDRIWYRFNWRFTLSVSHQTVSGTASTGDANSLSVITPYLVQLQLEIYTLCQSPDRIWHRFNWSCTLSVSHQTVSGTGSTGASHSLSVIRPYLVQLQLEMHTLCQSSDRIWYSFNWRFTLSVSHQTVSGTASTGAAHSLSVIGPYLVQLQLELHTL